MNRETGTKILLIGSFAASLVLPTLVYPAVRSHLDQQNYENRELASFPELSAANFDNIPTEFEAYYNDHVPFKNLFVKAKTKLDLELLNESSISDVTVGKENWLFYTVSEDGEDALADYQRTNLYTADEKTALADAITSVNEKMKERGIRFVMFEAPNKESVYAEYMPDSVRVYGSESRLDAALPELAAQGLPVYDMKPELLKEADTYQLYYKYDTHWNQIGSFIGSQQIAQTLLGTSTPLSAVSIEAAGPASGDLARMLNMAAEYSDDTEYVIQNYLPEVTATTVDMNEDNSFAVFESDSPNDKTLLVVGDSFSQNLKYFMPKLYRKTVFATFDTYTEALLDEYQPDDFVYLTVERNQELFEDVETVVWRDEVPEYELFTRLRQTLCDAVTRVQGAAAVVAELDCLCSLAAVAVKNNYCCPVVDESGVIEIHDGRHPVVECMRPDAMFVPNDTYMGEKENRAAIITGPNMAGKSTYMRQVALMVLMAQIGSFVPAKAARIGIVDRIFTRIGASDDLSAGQSTFMVEMTEVSDILRCATSRSLLILDEIGRGTSTFDGMSIARAVLEYCADPKKLGAKTLFATHYHELTAMEGTLPGVKNYNIAVKTRGEDIIFLRKIIPGGADRSYGIEVARLAGLPSTVVNRAKKILRQLEEEAGRPAPAVQAQEDQVSLTALSEGEVIDQLRRTQVDTLSPLEALNLLYELKKKLN